MTDEAPAPTRKARAAKAPAPPEPTLTQSQVDLVVEGMAKARKRADELETQNRILREQIARLQAGRDAAEEARDRLVDTLDAALKVAAYFIKRDADE